MLDIHSHILFGVDDGSRSLQESRVMLANARLSGINHIVCTPHCRWSDFDPELIAENFEVLREIAEQQGIAMTLGYEVNWKKLMELGISRAAEFKISGTNLFLLEFSDDALPANYERLVFNLQSQGLQLIIAHPERYHDIQKNLDHARRLKRCGCYLQLSANFIDNPRTSPARRTADALLEEDLVDYIASDAHRPEDYESYRRALAYARKF